jgi:hypothetical protein
MSTKTFPHAFVSDPSGDFEIRLAKGVAVCFSKLPEEVDSDSASVQMIRASGLPVDFSKRVLTAAEVQENLDHVSKSGDSELLQMLAKNPYFAMVTLVAPDDSDNYLSS